MGAALDCVISLICHFPTGDHLILQLFPQMFPLTLRWQGRCIPLLIHVLFYDDLLLSRC